MLQQTASSLDPKLQDAKPGDSRPSSAAARKCLKAAHLSDGAGSLPQASSRHTWQGRSNSAGEIGIDGQAQAKQLVQQQHKQPPGKAGGRNNDFYDALYPQPCVKNQRTCD